MNDFSLSNCPALAAEDIVKRFCERTATIGIIGLGYVGLPLLCTAAERGFSAWGFDIDQGKVEKLNAGESYFSHISSTNLEQLRRTTRLNATTDFSRLREIDAILLCVPTPLTPQREPDLSYVVKTTETIARFIRPGQLIVLESTTYPGTTRQVVRPILERSGLRSGRDFFLAYSPEREDPGNSHFTTPQIPKVIGGDGPEAIILAQTLYDQLVARTVPVSSLETAEAVKLTENIFRAVNIALVNELKVVFEAMKIDIWEVIEAAKTKPFGYMPFYPGPGLGGHCIPIDPFYLTWKAREFNINTRFIELAGEVNRAMPERVVQKAAEALSQRAGLAIRGAQILVVGVGYKKNLDDTRESPALEIIDILDTRGAVVSYHDPLLPEIRSSRAHARLAGRRSIALTRAALAEFDLVLICTDHDDIDYGMLLSCSELIVDTRNAFAQRGLKGEQIVKA